MGGANEGQYGAAETYAATGRTHGSNDGAESGLVGGKLIGTFCQTGVAPRQRPPSSADTQMIEVVGVATATVSADGAGDSFDACLCEQQLRVAQAGVRCVTASCAAATTT